MQMIKVMRQPSSTLPPAPQPPIPERQKKHFAAIIIGGTILCLNAGFINGVTLFHSGMASSHVTGTITKSAIDMEVGEFTLFIQLFFSVVCFTFGSFFTSILVSYQTFHLGRAYNRVFFFAALFLVFGCVMAHYWPGNTHYIYFTTVACGMQNAMTTSYSGSVLRTTHMTGMATDVGIVLGKIAEGNYKDAWKLKIFLPMMLGFFMGGMLGTLAARIYGEIALVINIFLFGVTGLLYTLYLSMKRNVGFWKALLSPEDLLRRHRPGRRRSTHAAPKEDLEAGLPQVQGSSPDAIGFESVQNGHHCDSFDPAYSSSSSDSDGEENDDDNDEDEADAVRGEYTQNPLGSHAVADEEGDDDNVELMRGKGCSS